MAKQTRGAITQGTVGVTALVGSLVGKEELITLELAQDACIFVDDIQATLGTPDEIDIITTKGLQGCLGIAVFGVSGQTDKAGYAFVHSAKWQNEDWWSGQEGAELISFAKKFEKLWVIWGTDWTLASEKVRNKVPAKNCIKNYLALYSSNDAAEHELGEFSIMPRMFAWFPGGPTNVVEEINAFQLKDQDHFKLKILTNLGRFHQTLFKENDHVEEQRALGFKSSLAQHPALQGHRDLYSAKEDKYGSIQARVTRTIFGTGGAHDLKMKALKKAEQAFLAGDFAALQSQETRLKKDLTLRREAHKGTVTAIGNLKKELQDAIAAFEPQIREEWRAARARNFGNPLTAFEFFYDSLKR
jgi:hypothetical protein